MSPEERYIASFSSPGSDGQSRRRRLVIIAILAVIILIGILLAFSLGGGKHPKTITTGKVKFSIIETIPALKDITTQTQSLQINFTQMIAPKSVSLTSSPAIITSSGVVRGTLTINLTPNTLFAAKTYTITIKSISNLSGVQLTNQKLSFTPIFNAPSFDGETALYDAGLTNSQVGDLNAYISQFKPWATTVAIDPTTVDHHRDNPNDPWSPWDISFSMSIDGIAYQAVTSYGNINSIQLRIFDSTGSGQPLFVAGNVGSP